MSGHLLLAVAEVLDRHFPDATSGRRAAAATELVEVHQEVGDRG